MDAVAMLSNRITATNAALHGTVAEVADVDWGTPVRPGTSPLGLTLWHLPRTQDWLLNTCILGAPEVADRPEFNGLPDPQTYGFGTGLTPSEASAVGKSVDPEALLSYADAVRDAIDAWLHQQTAADLDRPATNFLGRQQTRAAYATPAAIAEVEGLADVSVGVLLLRPAISHFFMHLGEVDALAQVARAARD